VVILADPAAPATHTNPSRYVDPARNLWVEPIAGCAPPELVEHRDEVLRRDQEEAVRLTYVAATRARDLLVVPAVGDKDGKDEGNWLDVLYPVIYPRAMERRRPKPAPGCPPFGGDSVLDRPAKAEGDPFTSVAPGKHAPKVGTHTAVWWDPHALELDKEQDAGLRQQRILQADEGESASNAGERAHAEWQAKRKKVLEEGALPALVVRTPTEISAAAAAVARRERAAREALGDKLSSSEMGGGWAGRSKAALSPEEVARDEAAAEALGVGFAKTEAARHSRPTGTRFGTLVHAALAEVDFGADEARIAKITAAQGRLLGAPQEEVMAAASAVRDALAHPLMKRAAASEARGECRREVPVMWQMPDGTMLEGVVDLVFREADEKGPIWTVVDFKSDAELSGRRAKYASQIKLYMDAVAVATGERARGLVLAV
jgi:ATP-dependent exoDNAse (exonuclease V) beta subunit